MKVQKIIISILFSSFTFSDTNTVNKAIHLEETKTIKTPEKFSMKKKLRKFLKKLKPLNSYEEAKNNRKEDLKKKVVKTPQGFGFGKSNENE